MEAAATISQPKTVHQFCVLTPKIESFRPIVSLAVEDNRQSCLGKGVLRCGRVRCAKGGGWLSDSDKILVENELDMEEEMIGMKKLNEKCKGIGGIVELMECLEREAIMGEDEGREPTDYNRRAQIFDKSSKVFQALKQQTDSASASASASAV